MMDLFGAFTCFIDWTMLIQSKVDKKIGKARFSQEESRIMSELEESEENLVTAFDEDQTIIQSQLLHV